MQNHCPGPDCRLGKICACILAIGVAKNHAVSGQRIDVRSEIHFGVVCAQVIGSHGVHHNHNDVGQLALRGGQMVNELNLPARLGVTYIRVRAKNPAKILTRLFR